MKKIVKVSILFLLFFSFYWLFNSGLRTDVWDQILQNLVFTILTIVLIFKPSLKTISMFISLILLIFMVIFFVLDNITIANSFGSLGFGILIISGLFYIPKLLKYGYIK